MNQCTWEKEEDPVSCQFSKLRRCLTLVFAGKIKFAIDLGPGSIFHPMLSSCTGNNPGYLVATYNSHMLSNDKIQNCAKAKDIGLTVAH